MLAVRNRWAKAVLGMVAVNDRLMHVRFRMKTQDLVVVVAHAPHQGIEANKRAEFYTTLSETWNGIKGTDLAILLTDANADVRKFAEEYPEVVQDMMVVDRNCQGEEALDNAKMFLEFCSAREMVIKNGRGKNLKRAATFTCPSGATSRTIDYIAISRRWQSAMIETRVEHSADISAGAKGGHKLVTARLKVKLRKQEAPNQGRKTRNDRKIYSVAEHRKVIEETIKQGMLDRPEEEEVEGAWNMLKDALMKAEDSIPKEEKEPRKPWITDATIEVCAKKAEAWRELVHAREAQDRIKLLGWVRRWKGENTRVADRNNFEARMEVLKKEMRYKTLKKDAEKAALADKRKLWADRCQKLTQLADRGDTREVWKNIKNWCWPRSRQCNVINDAEGNKLMTAEERRTRCANSSRMY